MAAEPGTGRSGKLMKSALTAVVLCIAAAIAGCNATPGGDRLSNFAPPPGTIKHTKFISAQECKICHPVEYQQWRSSMHAYAMESPVFAAFDAELVRSTGGTVGTFCIRCHSPIGISQGESTIQALDTRSVVGRQAVSCIVCHGSDTRDGQASGYFHVDIPGGAQPVIYGPFWGYDQKGRPNDPSLVLMKSPHESRHRAFITEGRFCGTCHDVLAPDGARLEEAYSEWKNSPYARRGVTCQDCHMSPTPGVATPLEKGPIVDTDIFPNAPDRLRSDHSFTGPDYSMIAGFAKADLGLDSEQFKKHTEMLLKQREYLFQHAAKIRVMNPSTAHAGETIPVSVAVTNTGTGHNLPTGFAAERQVWLEVIVTDAKGHRVFVSGNFDRFGDLRDHQSVAVNAGLAQIDPYLFNLEAYFIVQNFRGTQSANISTVNRRLSPVPFITPATAASTLTGFPPTDRQFKRGIPPFATKTANYRIRIPEGAHGPLNLWVRLRYRNFPPHLLYDLDAGQLVSKLQVIDMASYKTTIALQ